MNDLGGSNAAGENQCLNCNDNGENQSWVHCARKPEQNGRAGAGVYLAEVGEEFAADDEGKLL